MKLKLILATLALSFVLAGYSLAGTMAVVQSSPTANAIAADATLTGAVVNDFILQSTAGVKIGTQQALVHLTSGSYYNTAGFGADVPPSPALVGAFAQLAFDSFAAAGTATAADSNHTPTFAGKSDSLGGPGGAGQIMPTNPTNTTDWDAAWFTPPGQDTTGALNFLSARMTLSNTANGTWKYRATFSDTSAVQVLTGSIVNGVMTTAPIPEPATLSLMGLAMVGGLGLFRRRKS